MWEMLNPAPGPVSEKRAYQDLAFRLQLLSKLHFDGKRKFRRTH
jgi:hypothetical protein